MGDLSFMGQSKSKGEGSLYTGREYYAIALSFDKQSELRYEAGDEVCLGTRSKLKLFTLPTSSKVDFFKKLGLVLSTKGNRVSRNAVVVVKDYYRLVNGRLVKRNTQQGTNPSLWTGERGPAESSSAVRLGDILYAVNGRMIVNKTKSQMVKLVKEIIEKRDTLIITWKHSECINQTPWELEIPLPPPEGEYWQPYKEWGIIRPQEFHQPSSISL